MPIAPTSTPPLYKGKPPGKMVRPFFKLGSDVPPHEAAKRLAPGGIRYSSSCSPVLKTLQSPSGFEKGPFEKGAIPPGGKTGWLRNPTARVEKATRPSSANPSAPAAA